MINIILDDRLMSVVSLLDKNKTVADIGADHGLLSNYLINNKLAQKVYATEVSTDSIQPCIDTTVYNNNTGHIEHLVGLGLEPVLDIDLDVVVMAGMGADLIIRIIDKHIDYAKKRTLILQPQKNVIKLRKYLRDNGFRIEKEAIAIEGKFYYPILKVSKGQQDHYYSDLLGKNLVESKDFKLKKYIEYQIANNEYILDSLRGVPSAKSRQIEILNEQKIYKEVLDGYKK